MYSNEVIDEVVSRSDIVDIISGYIPLKRSGNSYMGLCPFHNEKSPSFSVSPSRQLYHCFGCGVGGNVITFVMEYENYSFPEAVKFLADKAGMELPEISYSAQQKQEKDLKTKLFEINKLAATYYYHQLKSENGRIGLEYLKKRGLSEETINRFGLGYSTQIRDDLYSFIKSKGYSDELLKESGLFTYERGIGDKFWNRVMFPIMNINNKVIGFGGRVMGDAKPKYLNSPETKLFDKSRNLYGLNEARSSRKNNMIICEGYMDVIALHQAGFNQAVASLGTALTPGQASLMKRFTDTVYITYDSDGAGVKAALRAIPILKAAGLSTKVVNMKPYKDPDEFIKNLGTDEFQKRLDDAENSFMYEISVIEEKYDREDPEGSTNFEKETALKLIEFSQKLERDNYIKAVCKKFNIEYHGMCDLVANLGRDDSFMRKRQAQQEMQQQTRTITKKKESGIRQAEKILLTWLIDDNSIYDKIKEYITPSDFVDPLLCDVAKKLFEQMENGNVQASLIINTYNSEERHDEVAALFSLELQNNLSDIEKETALNDTVRKIKENSINVKLENTTDPQELLDLYNQQKKLSDIHIKLFK